MRHFRLLTSTVACTTLLACAGSTPSQPQGDPLPRTARQPSDAEALDSEDDADPSSPDRSRAATDAWSLPEEALPWRTLAQVQDRSSGATVLKTAYDARALHVRIEGKNLSPYYNVFLDADADAETGITQGPWETTGIDLIITGGKVYRTGDNGWVQGDGVAISAQIDPSFIELTITSEQALAAGHEIVPDHGLGYWEVGANGSALNALPSINFARPLPKLTSTGVIIPAYLSPLDKEGPAAPARVERDWDRLIAQAEAFRTAGKDYWVTVTGPNSGPFGRPPEGVPVDQVGLEAARAHWRELRDKGAKLFGYVHTSVSRQNARGEFEWIRFRSEQEVLADVDAWLTDFGELDGIWIDEFNPEKESGASKAPRSAQYDPTGGFLFGLTKAIDARQRPQGGKLLTIGNVGAPLVTDRKRYAALVDVVCTFEATRAAFWPVPAQGASAPTRGISLQQGLKPRLGQLALVHTVTDAREVEQLVQRTVDEGYSHLVISHGTLSDNTLWRSLPPYFEAEMQAVLRSERALDGTF